MFPAWTILLSFAADLGLAAIIGILAWREVRVWLISKAEIETSALVLLAQYGRQAVTIAMHRELDASRNRDHLEEGRWRRVRKYIRLKQAKNRSDNDGT